MSIKIVYNWIEKLKSQYSNRDCVGWTPLLCIKYGSRLWTPPYIYIYIYAYEIQFSLTPAEAPKTIFF